MADSELNIIGIIKIDPVVPGESPTTYVPVPGYKVLDFSDVAPKIAIERGNVWPRLTSAAASMECLSVYNACQKAAAHNMMGPRQRINKCNNISAWQEYATGHEDDEWVIAGVTYGFPMMYRGPPPACTFLSNHPSATNFSGHVTAYIDKELELGALIGPFCDPPFEPWCHVAPLMTRIKANGTDRRIIVDLSFPPGLGPNSFIAKNVVFAMRFISCRPYRTPYS